MKAAVDTQNIYFPDLTPPLVSGLFLKHSGILSHGAFAHLFA